MVIWWLIFAFLFAIGAGVVGFCFWSIVGGCFADEAGDHPERRNYD
ncbi:TPA: hypothetical protein MC714_002119 [Serratia marcescens]|nr:hypothetical protein [Serratia marcescens]CVF31329.1 Uncharacterised protein [Serratia marcescens]HBC5200739.1 hypothetical protein [Serratia marcescens]HBU6718805.1 hypothetical protein [Serratia marcescens]HBU7311531.1 hypothetical protein [Serratia marcescens]